MNLLKNRTIQENRGYILVTLFTIFLILYAWSAYQSKPEEYQTAGSFEIEQMKNEQFAINDNEGESEEEDWDFDTVWDFSKDDEALFFKGYSNNPNLARYYDGLKQDGYFKGPYPKIQRHIQTDRLFHASYQGGDIAIYLKLSGFNGTAYYGSMVEGWYYDEKNDAKKTLKGIVFGDRIFVFNYDIKKIEDERFRSIQDYLEDVGDLDYFAGFKDFKECIIITREEKSWTKNGKTIPLKFKNEDEDRSIIDTEYEIFKTEDYLVLGPGASFDLRSVGKYTESWYRGDFKLIAYKNHTYLLEFNFLTNPMILGGCGGGSSKGILQLEFDKLHRLNDFKIYKYEDCGYQAPIFNKVKRPDANTIIYEYTDGETNEDRKIIVDLKNAKVTER